MKEFPKRFIPENESNFQQYNFDRNVAYLRRDIYESVIKCNKNDCIDLSKFMNSYGVKKEDMKDMVNIVIEELKSKGWQTTLLYGDTGLYVYGSKEDAPVMVNMAEDI
jgi:hypothetical protein